MIDVPTDDQACARRCWWKSIEMIERIWASEPPYEIDGKYWKTQDQGHRSTRGSASAGCRSPIRSRARRSRSRRRRRIPRRCKVAGRKGWSVISSTLLSDEGLANHWAALPQGLPGGRPGRRTATTGGCAVRSLVAATDEEARARAFSAESGYRHFFGHMHKVYTQLGRLGMLKTAARHARRRGDRRHLHRAAADLRLAQDRARTS